MNIGLIAHDAKKTLMLNFCIAYRNVLSKHTLYATGTTGRTVEEGVSLPVYKLLAGHLGGENQLCALIEDNLLDAVIFLRDPLTPKVNDPEPHNIIQLCDLAPIPIATNLASAEILLHAIERGDLDWRNAYR